MPGKRCSVVTCTNSIYKTKNIPGKTIMYHRFPRDNEIRKQWIYTSGKEGLWNPDHGWICSDHFTDCDYERNLKAELLKIPNRRKLKQTAIPNQKLPKSKDILSKNFKSSNRIRKRKVEFASKLELAPKQEVSDEDNEKKTSKKSLSYKNTPTILKRRGRPPKRLKLQEINNQNITEDGILIKQEMLEIESCDYNRETDTIHALNIEHQSVEDMKLKYEYLLKQNENLLMKNITLERELKHIEDLKKRQEETILKEKEELEKRNVDLYALLKKKVDALKNQEELEKKNNDLSTQISSLKFIDNKNKKLISSLETRIKNAETKDESCIEKLKHTFTRNQIDLLLKRKNKVPWTVEEITQAITIRYYSKRCYNYLRQKLNYPLPGLTTLKHWSSNSVIKQGILTDVFNSLRDASTSYCDSDKVVVLEYNVIKGTCENDQINDKVARPYSRVPVVQAQGLFSNWKHIVYVDFEKLFTTKELFNIVKSFEAIDFKVAAFVGDCGSKKLWHELNVTVDKSWFVTPTSHEKIFVFADASHLLKLLRNWFLDTGFSWEGGKKITQEHIDTLLYMNRNGELSDSFNLTSKHVLCKGVQRRVLELATDLFSHRTAEAIKKYLPDDPQVLETANFIELVSNWYNIFNSNSPDVDDFPLKSAFGSHLSQQTELLEKMFSEISDMHCGSRENNIIFQSAILMSINSLILLQKECKIKYNKDYIIMQKLQQDTLEKLFKQLKSKENQEPNPLNCLDRLRMIIMGKLPELQKDQTKIDTSKKTKTKQKQSSGKRKKEKKEYIFSMVDGQYVLKENIIADEVDLSDKINESISEDQSYIANNINEDALNSTSLAEEESVEDTILSNEDDPVEMYEDFEKTIDETFEETNEETEIEEDENIYTVEIDPNSNDEMSQEYIISSVLRSAGINIDAMEPGQIVEVIIENSNDGIYDDSEILHEVQIVDSTE